MKHFFSVISFFAFIHLQAQQYYNDAAVWASIDIEKKISKKFAIHLKQKDRWNYNASHYERGYADIGLLFKLTKNIKLQADYIFTEKRKNNNSFGDRHRASIALILKKDIGRWKLLYRNMFLVKYYEPLTSHNGYIPHFYDRNKFTLKYSATKRFEFFVAEELYIPINSPQVKGLDRSRSYAGLNYTVRRGHQLEFYFLLQAELQKNNWYKQRNSYPDNRLNHDYVYGVAYSISF